MAKRTFQLVFRGSGNTVNGAVTTDGEYPRMAFGEGSVYQTTAVDLDGDAVTQEPISFTAEEVGEKDPTYVYPTEMEMDADDEEVMVTVTERESGEVLVERTIPMARLGLTKKPPPPDPSTIRNDIEQDIIDQTGGKTLYRVGPPRISDVWLRSFTASRGSGGLGTGVYAYVSEEGARGDSSSVANPNRSRRTPQPVIALRGALKNPLIISEDRGDGVQRLNDASRFLSSLARTERQEGEDPIQAYRSGRVSEDRAPEGVSGPGRMDSIRDAAFAFFLLTNGQTEGTFLPRDVDGWVDHLLEACRKAALQQGDKGRFIQPTNIALHDAFDGVYPLPDAGGDSNKWGAVIFKQEIDRCVGRETKNNEEVDADRLNDCFAGEG